MEQSYSAPTTADVLRWRLSGITGWPVVLVQAEGNFNEEHPFQMSMAVMDWRSLACVSDHTWVIKTGPEDKHTISTFQEMLECLELVRVTLEQAWAERRVWKAVWLVAEPATVARLCLGFCGLSYGAIGSAPWQPSLVNQYRDRAKQYGGVARSMARLDPFEWAEHVAVIPPKLQPLAVEVINARTQSGVVSPTCRLSCCSKDLREHHRLDTQVLSIVSRFLKTLS